MRKPLAVVTGVDAFAMDGVLMSLMLDLPNAVAIRHSIDPTAQVLTRTVSSAGGVLETESIDLEHACVGCALREDIIPTIVRLARQQEWSYVVAGLPLAAEADHLARAISRDPRVGRQVRLASVLAAVTPEETLETLLSPTLLADLNLHTGPGDERGVGETACAQVEYADVIVTTSEDQRALDFLGALARPRANLIQGSENLIAESLMGSRHISSEAQAWRVPMTAEELPERALGHAWRLDLRSQRAFHPERLMEHMEDLAGGKFRSRGVFWVPTRPGLAHLWEGTSGQVSIGQHARWGSVTPITRLVLTGVEDVPMGLSEVFNSMLLSTEEASSDVSTWTLAEDGLEPWLGDIHRAA
ncbi:MAG: cobalamin biosynthesis protein CobW [Actinobacteria bacterium]|nr:cobalamin biosynthesis protein CobW [Actinomycetota bacterium]